MDKYGLIVNIGHIHTYTHTNMRTFFLYLEIVLDLITNPVILWRLSQMNLGTHFIVMFDYNIGLTKNYYKYKL